MSTSRQSASLAAASFKELLRLRNDSYYRGGYAISTDTETVYLSEHIPGQQIQQEFTCPRRMFNRLIAEYLKSKPLVRTK